MACRVLQAGCGALIAASLVALGHAPPGLAAHDGATPVAHSYAAVPTGWDRGGPLAIPTIGVVPPGLEDWYDPRAPRPLHASAADRSTMTVTTPDTGEPQHVPDEPAQTGAPPAGRATDPAPTHAPEPPSSTAGAAAVVPTPTTTALEPTSPTATTGPTPGTTTGPTPSTTTEPTPSTTTEPTPSTTTAPTTSTPVTTSPPPTETPPPTEEPPVEINERGNAVLGLGEQLTVLDAATGALVLAIGVDSVSADVTCTGPDSAPAVNGHLIAVQMRVSTGSDLATVGGEPAIRPADFAFLGEDGLTLTAAGTPSAESCLPEGESFPAGPLGIDQELSGVVVLDVPAISGTLVLAPDFLPVGGEWTY